MVSFVCKWRFGQTYSVGQRVLQLPGLVHAHYTHTLTAALLAHAPGHLLQYVVNTVARVRSCPSLSL